MMVIFRGIEIPNTFGDHFPYAQFKQQASQMNVGSVPENLALPFCSHPTLSSHRHSSTHC